MTKDKILNSIHHTSHHPPLLDARAHRIMCQLGISQQQLGEVSSSRYGASLGGPLCNTHNPTLGLFFCSCLHTTSDDNQTRLRHTTQTHNKHHRHGGGVTNPSGSMDLMKRCRLKCGRPSTCSFRGCRRTVLISS